MKITLKWLKRFLKTDSNAQEIACKLTDIGLELEGLEDLAADLKDFKVAEIVDIKPHPDADKLQICSVETSEGVLQIVCGAKNARIGIKVILAKIGTYIPLHDFKIKKTKIRGVESLGMLCSLDEIGIKSDEDGIAELSQNAIVGEGVAFYLGCDDIVFDINVTPNRPDALSVRGIARDLAAAGIGEFIEDVKRNFKPSFKSDYSVQIENHKACPYFSIVEIRGVNNKIKLPKWLSSSLNSSGFGSVNPIVDITNYMMLSLGQPMHCYDTDKIKKGLVIDTEFDNVEFSALNDKSYNVQKGDIVIYDYTKQVQCLGGVIGAEASATDQETSRIILESASFNRNSIASTGRRLHIDTDSRYRFERHVDITQAKDILLKTAQKIIEICGGEISEVIEEGRDHIEQITVSIDSDFIKKRSGIEIDISIAGEILKNLGLIVKISGEKICAIVPSWRGDIELAEDLVEEILRIYGYDKLNPFPLPRNDMIKIIPNNQRRLFDIKRLMAGAGYNEIISWSFMHSKKAALFGELKDDLTIKNPISSELDYMRMSIIPNLLEITANNLNRSENDLALFEVGPVFYDCSEQVRNNVGGVRIGNYIGKNVHSDERESDVFDIKADIAQMFKFLGFDLDKCKIETSNLPGFLHPTRSAMIKLDKTILGFFGEIHPLIIKNYEIKSNRVLAFEIYCDQIPLTKEKFGKKPLFLASNYQRVNRDFAFIMPIDQNVGDVLNMVKNLDKSLIKSVELFDIYQGDHIEKNEKSVAISVGIQSDNKTMSDEEIENISKMIISKLSEKYNAKLR